MKFAGLALATDVTQRMVILHPGTRPPLRQADGTDAWIELHSIDSASARKTMRAQQDRRLRMRSARPSADEIDADAVELLAALTAAWSLCSLDGDPIDVPCSAVNAQELYALPALAWLREQVDGFVSDRGNFRRAPSMPSSPTPSTTGA